MIHSCHVIIMSCHKNTLRNILDKHASMKRSIILLRLSVSWNMDKIREEKKKLERRWRSPRLSIDRQMLTKKCKLVNNMLKRAKYSYCSSIISYNTSNQKILFKLLHRRPEKGYPIASLTVELANKTLPDSSIH